MLWDDGFSSWRALKIPGQPAAILFAADGREIKRWQGPFPRTRFSASPARPNRPWEPLLALAFAAGLLAAFNPCGFAPSPPTSPTSSASPARSGRRRCGPPGGPSSCPAPSPSASPPSSVPSGLVVTLASVQVSRAAPWFTVVIAAGLVALGIAMIRGCKPKLSLPRLSKGGNRDSGLPGIFLFGVSYATVSLSCTLPPVPRRRHRHVPGHEPHRRHRHLPPLRRRHGQRPSRAQRRRRRRPARQVITGMRRLLPTSTAPQAACSSSPGSTPAGTAPTNSSSTPAATRPRTRRHRHRPVRPHQPDRRRHRRRRHRHRRRPPPRHRPHRHRPGQPPPPPAHGRQHATSGRRGCTAERPQPNPSTPHGKRPTTSAAPRRDPHRRPRKTT